MWEEAERTSEERRKWRKANIRTMGSRSGRYIAAKSRATTNYRRLTESCWRYEIFTPWGSRRKISFPLFLQTASHCLWRLRHLRRTLSEIDNDWLNRYVFQFFLFINFKFFLCALRYFFMMQLSFFFCYSLLVSWALAEDASLKTCTNFLNHF